MVTYTMASKVACVLPTEEPIAFLPRVIFTPIAGNYATGEHGGLRHLWTSTNVELPKWVSAASKFVIGCYVPNQKAGP